MLRKISSSVALGVLAGLFTAGCATNRNGGSDSSTDHGVMCPTCETVWVSETVGQGTKTQRMATEKRMTCPDCDRMAKAYLEGDKTVLHNCPTCKVTPKPVVEGATATHAKGSHGT